MIRRLLPAALFLLAAGAAAQEGPRCVRCKGAGLLPCGEHSGLDLAHEDEVLYCSHVHGCASCGGTGRVDCDRCESPEVERRLADKRAALEGRAAALQELDAVMERPLRKGESAHFVLVFELEELKVEKRRLDAHDLLHLYLARLEALHEAYVGTFGIDPRELEEKSRVFVWGSLPDHRRAGGAFCGISAEQGVKLMGATPRYSVAGLRRFFKDDPTLHRNVVHNVTHLLASHQRPSRWLGDVKGGWADEGVAHWFEDRFFGLCDNYCYQEVNTQQGFKGGVWRPAVRKLVAADEAAPAAQVMQKNTTVLTPEEHALAFSYVDFLIATDARKTNALLRALRAKHELRDALKEAFGWTVLEMEAAWKAWVLETYPTR